MKIQVLIEQMAANGYRVTGSAPFSFSVEAESREAALDQFRERINSQLASGAEIAHVDIGEPEPHPMEKFFGMWSPDDPEIEKWREAVEEYRRQVDEDPNIP